MIEVGGNSRKISGLVRSELRTNEWLVKGVAINKFFQNLCWTKHFYFMTL